MKSSPLFQLLPLGQSFDPKRRLYSRYVIQYNDKTQSHTPSTEFMAALFFIRTSVVEWLLVSNMAMCRAVRPRYELNHIANQQFTFNALLFPQTVCHPNIDSLKQLQLHL